MVRVGTLTVSVFCHRDGTADYNRRYHVPGHSVQLTVVSIKISTNPEELILKETLGRQVNTDMIYRGNSEEVSHHIECCCECNVKSISVGNNYLIRCQLCKFSH